MNPCVYILLLENSQYYIGATTNLPRRIKEHDKLCKPGTKYKKVVKILFVQECSSFGKARSAEHKLKKYKSRTVLNKIIKDGFMKSMDR